MPENSTIDRRSPSFIGIISSGVLYQVLRSCGVHGTQLMQLWQDAERGRIYVPLEDAKVLKSYLCM